MMKDNSNHGLYREQIKDSFVYLEDVKKKR